MTSNEQHPTSKTDPQALIDILIQIDLELEKLYDIAVQHGFDQTAVQIVSAGATAYREIDRINEQK